MQCKKRADEEVRGVVEKEASKKGAHHAHGLFIIVNTR
jgi:hypothetical protein